MNDAPKRIHVRWGKSGDTRVSYMEDRFWPPDNSADYILATPAALAASPEVQALIREAVAAERERCAAMIEGDNFPPQHEDRPDGEDYCPHGRYKPVQHCRECEAAAIRGEGK